MNDNATRKVIAINEEQIAFANRIYDTANRICGDAVIAFGPNLGFSLTVHALLTAAAQIVRQSTDPEAMWQGAINIAWCHAGEVIDENIPPTETKQ